MAVPQPKFRSDYRAPEFLIERTELTFALDDTATIVTNRMRILPQHPGVALVLDGVGVKLLHIELNGVILAATDYCITEHQLILPHVPAEPFELLVQTQFNPSANKALEGLYQSAGAFCTQCEAEGFRRITYYLDRPDVLAEFKTTIVADKQRFPQLLSNGNRVASGNNNDGRHWVTWHDPFPKPAYLFALVAGNFDCLEDVFITASKRTVRLQCYVEHGQLLRAKYALESLQDAMRWDEQRFGLEYDLDVYMIVAVDFFNMGAMENKGLNIFNSRYVLADQATATDQDFINIQSVIGHEYFHNWTGNRVTCRDWFQLSLKEGLTVFRDQEFSADMGSRAVHRIAAIKTMRTQQFNEDASPMAHPIRPEKVIEMNNFYTVTVYEKGAEVIRMLHTLLGERGFQAGLALYLERHDGQAVTCDDFIATMAAANQRDLSQFQRWYSQVGTPEVRLDCDYDAEQQQLRLRFTQQLPSMSTPPHHGPLHIPLLLSFYTPTGELLTVTHPRLQPHESGSLLFELTDVQQEVVLQGIRVKPVVAALENFTAPVRLIENAIFADKLTLLAHAHQEVTRWEAVQSIYQTLIQQAVAGQKPLELPTDVLQAFRHFARADIDPALKSLVLTVPTLAEMTEFYPSEAPLIALHDAIEQLQQQLAVGLADIFMEVWEQRLQQPYQLNAAAIAQRCWQHTALDYLVLLEPTNYSQDVAKHYKQADNMTAQQHALQLAVHRGLPCQQELIEAFEQQWQHYPLVLDKWFAIQASSPLGNGVERVQKLQQHACFDWDNPNRQYALMGSFSRNVLQFHQEGGGGYALLGAMIRYLNDKNPQVAARLITPLTQWRRFDAKRQELMKRELEQLQQLPNLAVDLVEKIGQSLAVTD